MEIATEQNEKLAAPIRARDYSPFKIKKNWCTWDNQVMEICLAKRCVKKMQGRLNKAE